MSRVSVKAAARSAKAAERKAFKAAGAMSSSDKISPSIYRTIDSLQNFAANLGIGTDNLSSQTGYGFNPVSRIRILLEWIYRGSWIGGVAINSIADDMTRAGIDIRGELDPKYINQLERCASLWQLWKQINATIRWARLYGGALGVFLIDGQDMATPLRIETVGKNSFRGILVLDRWMVSPSLEDLVTELGPDLGNPKFYTVIADSMALRRRRVHYSRCLRLEGIELPFQQKLMENMWGISVLERLYDRLIAFDSATTGIAQLLYKAYLRVIKVENLREITAAGGDMQAGLLAWVDFVRRYQSLEGITLLDMKDDATALPPPSFSGLADALIQLGQQLSGALEMPATKLFGQSPVGLNATGESDMRMYEDGIKQKQEQQIRVPVTTVYRVMAASEGIKLPADFAIEFRSIRTLTEFEKADLAAKDAETEMKVYGPGVITQQTALKDLSQLSKVSGRFTNISTKEINAALDESDAVSQRNQIDAQIEMSKESHEREGEEHDLNIALPKSKPNGRAATQ